jgi:hypothetical protein
MLNDLENLKTFLGWVDTAISCGDPGGSDIPGEPPQERQGVAEEPRSNE